MPNWCMNSLKVTGEKSELERFRDDVSLKTEDEKYIPLSFEKLFLTPPELLANNGWYSWRIENWGTKWDLYEDTTRSDIYSIENGFAINYGFDTAWAPPAEWLQKIAPLYPSLTFNLEFGEGGADFQGQVIIRNTDVIEDIEEKYDGNKWEGWVG